MKTEFAYDLRLARRKAGFTQRDSAHLLGITSQKVSGLEGGLRLPTILQLCTLCVIYGRNFESLFGMMLATARANLRERILTLPKDTRAYAGTRNRASSIDRLAQRLATDDDATRYGA